MGKSGPKPLPRKIFSCVDCSQEFSVSYINNQSTKVIKRCKPCDYKFKKNQGLFDFQLDYDKYYQECLKLLSNLTYAPSLSWVASKLDTNVTSLHRVLKHKNTTFHKLLDNLNLKPVGRSKFQHEIYLLIADKYPDLIQEYTLFKSYRADFFVPSKSLIIECDGPHHDNEDFYLNKLLKSKESKTTKERDEIKTKWCIEKGLQIVRIPYITVPTLEYIQKYLN